MSAKTSNTSTLWMGDIDESMSESFIKTSFNLIGYNPVQVKIVRNKLNGQPLGYGFVSFESEEMAQKVLQEINGQFMPNGSQGKKFRLNSSNREDLNEFSVYVGDLSPEVNDNSLLNAFATHYPSVCSAKVMVSEGQSRRFGFVRFSQENDYRNAILQCNNSTLLGPRPICVKAAKPRRPHQKHYNYHKSRNYDLVVNPETYVPQQQPEAPEPVYASDVNSYYSVPGVGQQIWVYPMVPYNALPVSYDPYSVGQHQAFGQPAYYPNCDNLTYSVLPGPIYVDHGHNQFIDSDKLNDEMIAKNEDLYASIENTRWSTPIDADKDSKLQ